MTNPHNIDRPDIVDTLTEFGKLISAENKPYITEIISITGWEGMLQDCSLYLIVPEIAYEYKVIEIEITNISECIVRFITLATSQVESYVIPIANGSKALMVCLNKIKSQPLFRMAITSLINRVEQKKSFRAEVSKRIIPGEARIAVLKDGTRINAGWIKIEDDKVFFYTGKGLRELWLSGMTPDQQRMAEEIKKRPVEQLIAEGYVATKNISDFREIL